MQGYRDTGGIQSSELLKLFVQQTENPSCRVADFPLARLVQDKHARRIFTAHEADQIFVVDGLSSSPQNLRLERMPFSFAISSFTGST